MRTGSLSGKGALRVLCLELTRHVPEERDEGSPFVRDVYARYPDVVVPLNLHLFLYLAHHKIDSQSVIPVSFAGHSRVYPV